MGGRNLLIHLVPVSLKREKYSDECRNTRIEGTSWRELLAAAPIRAVSRHDH